MDTVKTRLFKKQRDWKFAAWIVAVVAIVGVAVIVPAIFAYRADDSVVTQTLAVRGYRNVSVVERHHVLPLMCNRGDYIGYEISVTNHQGEQEVLRVCRGFFSRITMRLD